MSNLKYKSPSTGEECTPAQYLTELLLTRKYSKRGKTLPYKFWNIDKYKKEYRQQIFWCSKLFKTYRPEAVIRAFLLPRFKWAYSTSVSGIEDAILEEEEKLDSLDAAALSHTKEYKDNTESKHVRSSFNTGKSLRSKLE